MSESLSTRYKRIHHTYAARHRYRRIKPKKKPKEQYIHEHTHTDKPCCVSVCIVPKKREKTREAADRSLEVFSLVVILLFPTLSLSHSLSSPSFLYSSLIFIMTPRQTRCAPSATNTAKKRRLEERRRRKRKKEKAH